MNDSDSRSLRENGGPDSSGDGLLFRSEFGSVTERNGQCLERNKQACRKLSLIIIKKHVF